MKEEVNVYAKQAYDTVVANINSKDTDTVAMVKIPVSLLAIDEDYQTVVRTGRNLDNLVSNWDERKLAPILVSPHSEESKFYVVDGFGRWQASQLVDKISTENGKEKRYEYLNAIVLLKMPTNVNERKRIEAELFASQEDEKSKLKPIQMHGALRIIGDSTVLLMDSLADKYGFAWSKQDSVEKNLPLVANYSETKNMIKSCGKDCFEYIFSICKLSGFDRQKYGFAIWVMRALRDSYRNFADHDKVKNIIVEYFRTISPDILKSRAVTKYPTLEYKQAPSMFLEDYICGELGIHTYRTVENGKIVG